MHRFAILVFVFCGVLGYEQPAARADTTGGAIYRQYCATCHGLDARGGNASSLFDDRWSFGGRPAQLRQNIVAGIATHGMPAFGEALTAGQVDTLIAYITAMRGQAAAPPARRGRTQPDFVRGQLRLAGHHLWHQLQRHRHHRSAAPGGPRAAHLFLASLDRGMRPELLHR